MSSRLPSRLPLRLPLPAFLFACVVCAPTVTVSACARAPTVERVYDGHVVDGRFIAPEGYAAFLRGASADAGGDLKGSLASYAEAIRIDERAPEIWTRIGDVRCRLDPRDQQADAGFARALALDAAYARAWAAKARCALSRNDVESARAAARRAAQLDPEADTANALLARTAAPERRESERSLLVALTLTAREPIVAWDALAGWARASDDMTLLALSLVQLARLAPGRREDIAMAAEELAGEGEIWLARGVAAAAADADERPLAGDHPLAARLAVDDAIEHGAVDAVSRRATRVRLPPDEAAGRALLRGHRSLAVDLASAMARGDATAVGARLVLAVGVGSDVLAAAQDASENGRSAASAALVAFGGALARATSADASRTALAAIRRGSIIEGDDMVVRPAVALVLRGVLAADVLPADGVVELAARRGGPLREDQVALAAPAADLRHEYLWLALTRPESERAKKLSAHFAGAVVDPFVAAASALMKAAAGAATASAAAQMMLARDAGDPLIAAVALRIARKTGDAEMARRASAALTALGETLPVDAK
jgi:hypothetical protein